MGRNPFYQSRDGAETAQKLLKQAVFVYGAYRAECLADAVVRELLDYAMHADE